MDEKPTKTATARALSAFVRLPDEIIQQILQLVDPNSFASLVLLNSKWRCVSQQAHLYALHLSRCPSYSATHNAVPMASVNNDSLPKLRRFFAREVKRNLFEAYLRPKTMTVKLISNSISSSSVPGGEGMQFSPSPRGHHLLAYNSSRIYVIDLRGAELDVKRELKILRRPVSTCILDDGSVLAVLSTDTQVDLYDLRQKPPKRTQSLILDHTPRTIAMSPCGSVLAAAYEGGIEVSSLSPGALPTERRAVKCDGVDSLAFSFDGTQLLGTTTHTQPPNTVILTAPYYDPGSHMGDDNISALWTASILFPNTSRDCSHAVLLQESSSQEASWTFTYDRSFETFRAVRIDDLRNGTTYFTGPIPNTQPPLLPCTLPAASYCGELVSAGFEGQDVWLYGIPEDLEAVSDSTSAPSDSGPSGTSSRGNLPANRPPSVRTSSRAQETNGGRVPQWQVLCDKYRNTFVSGRKLAELRGVSTVKWVAEYGNSLLQERLIIAACGIQPPKPITEEDEIDFVDGGRVTIFDFDFGIENGEVIDLTIEVGTKEPEVLEEEHRDMATEVAIVRRRTVAQRGGNRSSIMRSAPTAVSQSESLLRPHVSPLPDRDDEDDPLIPRRMIGPRMEARAPSNEAAEGPEEATLEEAQEALDAPYAHASPRSGTTLRRAATAAAVNRRLHPSAATAGRVEYRRADGRAEHPHESDADNWVPPPPPYAKEDPGDLPAFLRHAAIPGVRLDARDTQVPPPPATQLPPQEPSRAPSARPELPRIQTSPARQRNSGTPWVQRAPGHQRVPSDSADNIASQGLDLRRGVSRSVTPLDNTQSQGSNEGDISDVSPVESLRGAAQYPVQGASQNGTQERRVHSNAPSWGTIPSASDGTSVASASHLVMAGTSRPSAVPYALDVFIPSATIGNAWVEDEAVSNHAVGRLSNTQTWPLASEQPEAAQAAVTANYPHSAPPTGANNTDIIAAALPPLPRPDQLSSLHNRRDSSAPRRASGSFQFPRVPVGRDAQDPFPPTSTRHSQVLNIQPPAPEPEQPLIISTPTGVSGAFDPPGRRTSQRSRPEPILHAPVPLHPRATLGSTTSLRPTAECLETMYSVASFGDHTHGVDVRHYHSNQIPVPAVPSSQLTSSSLRHHTSLTRTQSRARRSAAKNVQDAKGRGWTGRRKNKKRKDTDTASSAAWTDVTWASNAPRGGQVKERRCVVM
ncbi:uncharacterized protein BCR38DRAFT_339167 [Pseudomassariella vexata]|uniref:F-box domain-containing protein n=1 Tax=Pseudomassariella vexata TaxID=1141098 RepID=A0A1Y2E2S2_9PEZI|nr:uncharacterized protein BCR38DRAFT_339167 [Pseudomassariella vexata]ORY65832.1 hypothetical protein BCR38DRAFT_339167 [Pseudomassariella vexata]